MTIVVLLILAAIWAFVLIPPIMRARAEGRPGDSIGDFRRQLYVLQRTGPTSVNPANRLYAPASHRVTQWAAPGVVPTRLGAEARRRRTQERRRDVLVGLLVGMSATLLLGFLPALRVMWILHVVLDGLCFAYVALLIRLRNMALERERKVRFLPGHPAQVEPAFLARRYGS